MVMSCIVELDNTCDVYQLIYKVVRYLFNQLRSLIMLIPYIKLDK